jgi:hypothetical protein
MKVQSTSVPWNGNGRPHFARPALGPDLAKAVLNAFGKPLKISEWPLVNAADPRFIAKQGK